MHILESITLTEILGSVFSIIYSILLIREKIAGWAFGIASSVLSLFLFIETKLYAQAAISLYYAFVGMYGWYYWVKAKKRNEHITRWSIRSHITYILLFAVISLAASYLFSTYTDSSSPYLDSFLTSFGLLASIKEARKILTSWIYWLIINGFSVWLYFDQHLYFYAVMMIIYAGICIPGYLNWLRIYRTNRAALSSTGS